MFCFFDILRISMRHGLKEKELWKSNKVLFPKKMRTKNKSMNVSLMFLFQTSYHHILDKSSDRIYHH